MCTTSLSCIIIYYDSRDISIFSSSVFIFLIHYKSQPYSSLSLASRPLMLSHKRRLYLHLYYLEMRYFSSTLSLWFYSPSRRQSLKVSHIYYSDLGLSLLNIHSKSTQHQRSLCVTFILSQSLIGFYFSLCYPYCFFCFRTITFTVSSSALVIRLQELKAINTESALLAQYRGYPVISLYSYTSLHSLV